MSKEETFPYFKNRKGHHIRPLEELHGGQNNGGFVFEESAGASWSLSVGPVSCIFSLTRLVGDVKEPTHRKE